MKNQNKLMDGQVWKFSTKDGTVNKWSLLICGKGKNGFWFIGDKPSAKTLEESRAGQWPLSIDASLNEETWAKAWIVHQPFDTTEDCL